MSHRVLPKRVVRSAGKGAVIGLFASFSIRLAETPLQLLVWIVAAVSLGSLASVLHEFCFGSDEQTEKAGPPDPYLPLMVTCRQLQRAERVSLDIPGGGPVEIHLQPHWRDGGCLKISGLASHEQPVVARIHVME